MLSHWMFQCSYLAIVFNEKLGKNLTPHEGEVLSAELWSFYIL